MSKFAATVDARQYKPQFITELPEQFELCYCLCFLTNRRLIPPRT